MFLLNKKLFLLYVLLTSISKFFLNIEGFSWKSSESNKKLIFPYLKSSEYLRIKRKIYALESRKWTFPIIYEIEKNKFNDSFIEEILKNIEDETCIQFEKRNKTNEKKLPILKYFLGNISISHHGKQNKVLVQSIMITKNGQTWGNIMHETLHAMGMIHEHMRKDRDLYITIHFDNIQKFFLQQFILHRLKHILTFDTSYDFGSIMHYKPYDYSKNKHLTSEPKESIYLSTLGSSRTASFNDFKALNMYYCKNKCTGKIECKNGGYQNPNNCNICKCPDGFEGNLCNENSKGINQCGDTQIAEENEKEIYVSGEKSCTYHITVNEGEKIDLFIVDLKFIPYRTCHPSNCLEVKYWKDLTPTGARLCQPLKNYRVISKGSHIVLFYRSNNSTYHARIKFKKYKEENLEKAIYLTFVKKNVMS